MGAAPRGLRAPGPTAGTARAGRRGRAGGGLSKVGSEATLPPALPQLGRPRPGQPVHSGTSPSAARTQKPATGTGWGAGEHWGSRVRSDPGCLLPCASAAGSTVPPHTTSPGLGTGQQRQCRQQVADAGSARVRTHTPHTHTYVSCAFVPTAGGEAGGDHRATSGQEPEPYLQPWCPVLEKAPRPLPPSRWQLPPGNCLCPISR